jgi:hypothetical protein
MAAAFLSRGEVGICDDVTYTHCCFWPPEPALHCNSRSLLVPLHVMSDARALVGSTLG